MLVTTLNAAAHEMSPSIVDAEVRETDLILTIITQGEAIVAGVDLSSITDTNDSAQADVYDALRALPAMEFALELERDWPTLGPNFRLFAGETPLSPVLENVATTEAMSDELPRQTRLVVSADLPDDGTPVTVAWAPEFGPMILRQIVEDDPDAYSAFLGPGQKSEPMPRDASAQVTGLKNFANYIYLGFTHIIPKGLDHILFVLGLFFFSRELRPLFFQVSTFTVAHTITLALATLGLVTLPSSLVEPLIALSIAFIAFENILRPKLSRFRLIIVFFFGLLHGLGFASVLGDIGLSAGHFIASLIAFNIGVEFGQIAVLLVAFFAVSLWFGKKPYYRPVIVIPASAAIGLMGLYWAVERVIL